MADVQLKTTFQLRRGKYAEWEEVNPTPRVGEPCFAYDLNILKIGDGVHSWKNLEPINIQYVIDAPTKEDFPTPGDAALLYKAYEEKAIYQWNTVTSEFEKIASSKVSAEDIEIDIIDGGKM